MKGHLIVYWDGDKINHFLHGIFDFPEVTSIVPRKFSLASKVAEKYGRTVNVLNFLEAKTMFKPDYVFYYSKHGGSPETIAAKLKQDFIVMLVFGHKEGEPVKLSRRMDSATAAPIMIYEISKLLRGFI
ncbi:MAG: hypothetical protein GOU99_00670 [Candidatus Altiarchaeota archaeon]|nr:hypothetical protein [Candidatus Altiarchaeota archaeon]